MYELEQRGSQPLLLIACVVVFVGDGERRKEEGLLTRMWE